MTSFFIKNRKNKGFTLKRGLVSINRGFTLIELLVVIAIIGILATIIVASFTSAQKRARDSKRKGDLDALKKALSLFKNDTPGAAYFPSCPGDSTTSCVLYTVITATTFNFNQAPRPMTPAYIKLIPQDPQNVAPNQYTYDPGPTAAVLCTTGVGTVCPSYAIYVGLENLNDPDAAPSQTRCNIAAPTAGRYMVCNE